ncbi:MAG: CvpA family protein [Synergistaceae bacterium]|jgi:uncharacterized membrane protein required for colicin V production|nr:CvpA family protein [Synergistaceae bacterium]
MTVSYIFDIGAACVLAFFVVRGGMRGLTGEIVSLLGLIASVAGGWTFARPLAEVVLGTFPAWDKTLTELVCSVAIFMAVSLVFSVVARVVQMLVQAARLSFLDHALGTVSGAARAFFFALFIYGAFSIFSPILPNAWMRESYAMRGAAVVWPSVLHVMVSRGWIDLDQMRNSVTGGTATMPSPFNIDNLPINGIPINPADVIDAAAVLSEAAAAMQSEDSRGR